MRSMWTGAIGFGLVNIPIKLYSATERNELSFDMLDKGDQANIKYQRVNGNTGKEVPYENIVKGYKMDDRYIIIDDKDFESAYAEKTKTIAISDFVDENEIDTSYYEAPYYLEPDKSGVRAYALLREALIKTKKVGIASFVMRNKESLAVLRANEKVIVLNKIRFAQELRDPSELKLPESKDIKKGELDMAIALINSLDTEFDITAYRDTYTDKMMEVIQAKAQGVKTKTPQMKVVHSATTDLMAQLKASLGAKKKKAS